jgi:hypothetical protein
MPDHLRRARHASTVGSVLARKFERQYHSDISPFRFNLIVPNPFGVTTHSKRARHHWSDLERRCRVKPVAQAGQASPRSTTPVELVELPAVRERRLGFPR